MKFTKEQMRRRKGNKDIIIEGVRINESTFAPSENRIFTLLIKGFITYLVCTGIVGSALTSTGTLFNHVALNVSCAIFSAIMSFIYYSKITENIGDILYFLIVGFVGVFYSGYINSGFYTWMNDLLGRAGSYFNINEIGGYTARINDPYLTVSFAACYLCSIAVILIYITIVRKMHFLDMVIDCSIVIFLPTYLELEPNFVYFGMVICGIVFSYIWNSCKISGKTNDNKRYTLKKEVISYVYNIKAVLQAFGLALVAVVIAMILLYVTVPKDEYSISRQRSSLKDYTDDTISNIMTSGMWAFFNRYENVGGLNSGRLGGVNSISMDYQTDLYVTYAPYNYNAVYIRDFIAGDYVPFKNYWNRANSDYIYTDEYDYLRKLYGKCEYSGKGTMIIENVDTVSNAYTPYYSLVNDRLSRGNSMEVTYFTRLNPMMMDENMRKLSGEEYDYWTSVPEENVASIERFIDAAGLDENMSELECAMAIRTYFVENVPYTLRPGATPRKRDFINYFLDNNRKGYCTHFASAGAMALRYLGIPARYVEGYCFDYDNMLSATIVEGDYSDYYKGYSELDEKGILKVDITDADAHAWVEIFIDGYGWTYVELTPPSSDTEFLAGNIFSRIFEMINSSDGSETTNVTEGKGIDTSRMRAMMINIVICLLVIVFLVQIIRGIVFGMKYINSGINDRLVIRYHLYLLKKSRRYPVSDAVNYREQLLMLMGDTEETARVIAIMEKAGFSNTDISEEEFEYVTGRFK